MGKWTPGPYEAGHYSSVVGIPITAQPDKKLNTIVLGGVHQSSVPWPREGNADNLAAHRAECEATARLMAAAPDLVKALGQLLTEAGEGSAKGRALDLLSRGTIKQAQAALAKARGEQS